MLRGPLVVAEHHCSLQHMGALLCCSSSTSSCGFRQPACHTMLTTNDTKGLGLQVTTQGLRFKRQLTGAKTCKAVTITNTGLIPAAWKLGGALPGSLTLSTTEGVILPGQTSQIVVSLRSKEPELVTCELTLEVLVNSMLLWTCVPVAQLSFQQCLPVSCCLINLSSGTLLTASLLMSAAKPEVTLGLSSVCLAVWNYSTTAPDWLPPAIRAQRSMLRASLAQNSGATRSLARA